MPLPGDIDLITITTGVGFYDAIGSKATGTIKLQMPFAINDLSGDYVVLAHDQIGNVTNGILTAANGVSPFQVLPTNHPNMEQQDWTYHVIETFSGEVNRPPYDIVVPYDAAGGIVDLAQVVVGGIPSSLGTTQVIVGPQGESWTADPDLAKLLAASEPTIYRNESTGVYPIRTTVTADTTKPVRWSGTVAPAIGGDFAIDGVDYWRPVPAL
jgi:hypothetical protein